MKTISLTFFNMNKLVTAASIFECFCAQQGAYMQKRGETELVVPVKQLKKYADLCFKAFKANLKICATARDHKRLFQFFAVKTSSKGRDFLNAMK